RAALRAAQSRPLVIAAWPGNQKRALSAARFFLYNQRLATNLSLIFQSLVQGNFDGIDNTTADAG
ncbi:MAG: hypothetical protein KDE03_05105, partial [Rhodobacteraceae bacterium]|nr:hypothetical protein [Paracoccaceae bacterium]